MTVSFLIIFGRTILRKTLGSAEGSINYPPEICGVFQPLSRMRAQTDNRCHTAVAALVDDRPCILAA